MSVEKTATEVRQGETSGRIRLVLGVSLTVAVLALIGVAIFSV
jgi:hypothetical protein